MYIGTLPCEQTAGGPVQMYRHFIERKDFDFQAIIEPPIQSMEYIKTYLQPVDRLLVRASKTRLYPDFVALNVLMAEHRASSLLLDKVLAFNPQAIVTIAFGSYSFVASHVARQLKLPLITFFHDWWPDLTPCRGLGKKLLDNRFRILYKESNLALCVCESMYHELGYHPSSVVLYPIPNSQPPVLSASQVKSPTHRLRLVYLGTMGGDYAQMLQLLVRYLQENPQSWLDLKLYGSVENWPEYLLSLAQETGIYGGMPEYGSERAILAEADAYLVVTSFEEKFKRRVQTSFPSKILEYAAYGKPIIAWGPEYSSAIKFLQKHTAAVVATMLDPGELIKCLFLLHKDSNHQLQIQKSAQELSKTLFNPSLIHNQLINLVDKLITH